MFYLTKQGYCAIYDLKGGELMAEAKLELSGVLGTTGGAGPLDEEAALLGSKVLSPKEEELLDVLDSIEDGAQRGVVSMAFVGTMLSKHGLNSTRNLRFIEQRLHDSGIRVVRGKYAEYW